MLDLLVSVFKCPGIQELLILGSLGLSLVVSLLNYRQIKRVSNTPALKDHLKKKRK